MKMCFIRPSTIFDRSADPLFMCKTASALMRLGHLPFLIAPRKNLFRSESQDQFQRLLDDFAIPNGFPLVQLPRPVVMNHGHGLFSLFAALYARVKSVHYVWTQDILAADLTTSLRIPTIFERHVLLSVRQLAILRKCLPRSSFRCFVANSEAHRAALIREQHLPADKIFCGHGAVEISQFNLNGTNSAVQKSALGLPADRPVVVYSGSLYHGRGIEEIIEASKELGNVYFLCIGGRPEEVAGFRDRVQKLQLFNIQFSGYVPNRDISTYLSAADILVAPYREDCEAIDGQKTIAYASPMKLPEYMAAAKPIVTSDIGAIPEVIEHGKSGILVPPGDSAELIQALKRLLSDEPLRRRLGMEARRLAEKNTWETRSSNILRFSGVYCDS